MNLRRIIPLSCLVLLSTPLLSYADPVNLQIDIQCPIVNSSSSTLSNFGDYIAGYGMETVSNQMFPIYFKSGPIQNIPAQLTNYVNSNTQYDSTKGTITCSYTSNDANPPFTVMYDLTNGKGGVVTSSSANSIDINLPVGM